MTRKSKKLAVKYSQLSKTKKKKPRNEITPSPRIAYNSSVDSKSGESAVNTKKPVAQKQPSVRPVSVAQSRAIQSLPKDDYVKDDLKRIAILSGAMIIILVVLAFVMGNF